MFLAFCALLLVVSVPVTGGRLSALARLRLQRTWLLWTALAVQVLVTEVDAGVPSWALAALHVGSYGLAAAFVWGNRQVPGILVLWLGASLNLLAIAANGGTLPASASALRRAGLHPDKDFENSRVLAHPHLAWLGDTMATPSWLPFRNVISVGDLVIVLGAALLLHVTCRRGSPARLPR